MPVATSTGTFGPVTPILHLPPHRLPRRGRPRPELPRPFAPSCLPVNVSGARANGEGEAEAPALGKRAPPARLAWRSGPPARRDEVGLAQSLVPSGTRGRDPRPRPPGRTRSAVPCPGPTRLQES